MEVLLLGAGLLAFSSIRESANEAAKATYPSGEKDRVPGNHLTEGYEPGMDRSMLLVNRRAPNFPVATFNSIPIDTDVSFALTEAYAGSVLRNRAFMEDYAATYAEFQDVDHPLLDVDRQKWNYSTRKTEARWRGSEDDYLILGHRTGLA